VALFKSLKINDLGGKGNEAVFYRSTWNKGRESGATNQESGSEKRERGISHFLFYWVLLNPKPKPSF
jgi:hypothetical protein